MASLPMILHLADDLDRLSMVVSPFYLEPTTSLYRWPSRSNRLTHVSKELSQMSPIGKDGFQMNMSVTQFQPNELNVKVVDNSVVVEGKHEEREDEHGYISRHFVRRYALPKGYEPEKVMSTLSSDGVLTVSIPKPQLGHNTSERVIQIQQTGPAHLNVKENQKVEKDGKEKMKK